MIGSPTAKPPARGAPPRVEVESLMVLLLPEKPDAGRSDSNPDPERGSPPSDDITPFLEPPPFRVAAGEPFAPLLADEDPVSLLPTLAV
jgi:hypothetical protein